MVCSYFCVFIALHVCKICESVCVCVFEKENGQSFDNLNCAPAAAPSVHTKKAKYKKEITRDFCPRKKVKKSFKIGTPLTFQLYDLYLT